MTRDFILDDFIGKYPDYPKPGILYYDISPALADASILRALTVRMAALLKPMNPDIVVGVDARGFLFATPIALQLEIGTIMVRKAGKLPGALHRAAYGLEYGEAELTLQKTPTLVGKKIALVDDLVATGGTLAAAAELVEKAGGHVVCAVCAIELLGLGAREKLNFPIKSIQEYEAK
ncbi:MAG: adenine phosphoribosyltransferase [Kordiimonadaceae bacterium]|nr:adenine phosphoribosyltransferase [Kordiimonadaceae bacterium]